MDDDKTHVRTGDVDDPYHISSVHRDLHDSIHEEDGDGVVHQPEHDVDDMKEVYWEEVVVDEEEDAWQVVEDEDELQGEWVGDVGHSDVVHLYDDEVDLEDASHEQHVVVEQQFTVMRVAMRHRFVPPTIVQALPRSCPHIAV